MPYVMDQAQIFNKDNKVSLLVVLHVRITTQQLLPTFLNGIQTYRMVEIPKIKILLNIEHICLDIE